MSKKVFSTGLPKFDYFIGSLSPADSFLVFLSESEPFDYIIHSIANYSTHSKFPVVYLSVDDLEHSVFLKNKKFKSFSISKLKTKRSAEVLREIKRFADKNVRNSYLIVDELSKWVKPLGSEQKVVELFEFLIALIEKRNSVLICSALRSNFQIGNLIRMKDEATICLDFIKHQDQTYCLPLTCKGRYRVQDILPLRFDIRELSKPFPEDQYLVKLHSVPDAVISTLEARYENLFRESNEAMFIFDRAGDFREVNSRATTLLGYSIDELKLINPFSIVSDTYRFRSLRFFQELKRRKKGIITLDIIKKNGTHLPAEIQVSNISNTLYFGIIHDLSEKKKYDRVLQQKTEEYEKVVEGSSVAIIIVHDNKPLYVNKLFSKLFSLKSDVDIREIGLKEFLTKESFKRYQRTIRELKQKGESITFEAECVRSNGSTFYGQLTLSEISYQRKQCTQVSIADITNQKRFIDELNQSEQRYRHLVENAITPATLIQDSCYVYANKAVLELFGYESNKEILDKPIEIVVEESDKEHFKGLLLKSTSGKGKVSVIEFNGCRRDKKDLLCELTLIPIHEGKGNYFVGYFHDKTEENKVKEELQLKLEESQLVKEILPSLVSFLDVPKLTQTGLHKLMEVLSWEIGAIYLKDDESNALKIVHGRNFPEAFSKKLSTLNLEEGIGGLLAKTQTPHKISVARYPSYLSFRAMFKEARIREISFIPLIVREKFIGLIILCTKKENARYSSDLFTAIGNNLGSSITNSIVYQKIRDSENQKSRLIESSSEILYITQPNGVFTLLSSKIEELVGYPVRDFQRTKDLWLRLIHPEDKRIILERMTKLREIIQPTTYEYRVLPKGKAEYRWIRDIINIVKDEHQNIVRVFGTIRDITDEKQILAILSKENSLSRDIYSSIIDGICVFDMGLKFIFLNRTMEKILGKTEKEMIGKNAAEILPSYQGYNIENLLKKTLEGSVNQSEDIPLYKTETQEQGYIRCTFSPYRNKDGEIRGIVSVLTDVSQRKTFENEIRESEHILSNVIDTMGDILILTDLTGRVIQINKAFIQLLGYSRSEINGCDFPYPWLIEEEMGRLVLWISNLREHNWLHDFDMTMRAKDGRLIPVSLSTTLLRNSMGEPIAMLNIARNITERKRLMKDLENRNQQIEMLNRIVTKANQTMDFREIFKTLTEEIQKVVICDDISIGQLTENGTAINVIASLGGNEGNILDITKTVSQYTISEQVPVLISDFKSEEKYRRLQSNQEGLRSQISLPILMKGKIFGTLNLASKEPFTFSEEHISTLLPIAQQIGAIIDRIQLFHRVSEDSAYIHNLLDSIDSVVYTVDTHLQIREVNRAWYDFIRELGGVQLHDYHQKNLFDVVPNEQLKIIYQNIVTQLLNGSIRIFSQEFNFNTPKGERIYQTTINPMVIERKIVGLVFTHTDITTLKKTEADLKKSNDQLLALHEISTVLSSSFDLQKMLHSALPLLKNIIDATAIIVYLQDHEGDDLILVHQIGFEIDKYARIHRLQQSTSATGEVIKKKQAMYISDKAYLDERIIPANREILLQLQISAIAVIPLLSKDRVFGALDIFYNTPHEYSDQEQQILTLVGNQLGAAIENTTLYKEIRSQVERLTVLYDLSQQLTSTLNVDQIFQTVYKHVKQIAPCKNFTLDLYNEKIQMVTPAFNIDESCDDIPSTPAIGQSKFLTPGTPYEQVVISKNAYQSPDKRTIIIPMLSKEIIIGIMSVVADDETIYTDTHLKLLESIGNLTAISLEKGKLYEETLQKSIEIQRRNKELDDFTYVVSHDLKEPLISVEGFSKIIQADYQDIIQQEGKEYLDSIVGATARMKGLIDDLLLLSRISRPSEAFKDVQIKSILDEIKTYMVYTIKQKGVNIVIPDDLPSVYGNETQLKIVFRNLLSNAVKFNNNQNPLVEVGFQNVENNYYLFFVKDNGLGIEKDFHDKIFVIFQRLHRREEYEGSGAGLAIVKKIIELHNGKIWVESEIGKGSTFFFTIPKTISQET
ncbi:MAG: PAS domain S-box protein [Bacteroidota bacterium]|nr:PAS domain S-box protein [Bacteroidota bacterium]